MLQMRKDELLESLVAYLCAERDMQAPCGTADLWSAFRALVNTRPPWEAADEFLREQDELLQGLIAESGVRGLPDAQPSPENGQLLFWRGDITTFAADAIVNAANAQMLGCWAPGHFCIDNAIHTYAGVQLRLECARIMQEQGHDEPTGLAKITPAYNLPANYVLHTVGPIANGHPTGEHRTQLASCYASCLNLAARHGLGSVAFCCISTGVFGFPQREAAEIAVCAVRDWLAETHSPMKVVFNVFGDVDERIYRNLLSL